ncbi:sortase-dependent protein [Streptomyces olivaceus]|uniref:sortase-dependent protein n=1 Tax=Streptomyces olivaceus TaxID=47716 RepID=UPI0033B29006
MRRTLLSAAALACAAVLATTAPASADDSPRPAPTAPSEERAPSTGDEASAVPSEAKPGEEKDRSEAATPVPAERAPGRGQVSAVPEGAADTGVATSESSGTDEGLIGAGAGAVLLAGGVTLLVVRRRRAAATGA